jgi:arylsulfatase B
MRLILLFSLLVLPLAAQKPNILMILADDMGYGDLGCYGSLQIETPVLDQLAADGIRCTDGYVCANVCAPSRAGLLTGRHPQRFGFEHNLNKAFPTLPERLGVPVDQPTIATHLKKVGYRTSIIGKWHVGDSVPGMLPNAKGFDYFFGMHAGSHNYFPTPEKNKLLRNENPVKKIDHPYLTDWFTHEAISQMTPGDNPFFCFLSYNTPHTPMQAKDEDLKRFTHLKGKRRQTYAAMQWCMDQNIGKILDHLREQKLLENTLIVFYSDNGGSVTASHACNAPLRGMKGSFLEGGIRVPFIFSWPKGLPSGKTFSHPFTSLDLLPTFIAASGGPKLPDKIKVGKKWNTVTDGKNLLPYLRGENSEPPHERLYWRMTMRGSAIREGDWKLLINVHTPPALYNLVADISEQKNLYQEMPEKVADLWLKLNKWQESLEDTPHWQEDPYWQGYNRKLYSHTYWLTQPKKDEEYDGLKR